MNHIAVHTHQPIWRAIGDACFTAPVRYPFAHDRALAAHGLQPLEAYLAHYRRHHEAVLEHVPPARLM